MNNFMNKVVYQIYPRSFMDSNGDGLGDLKGITQKLDYLKQLGVDYIWITPFFISPQRDNGYDIADYYRIDSRFGSMEDFEELSRKANALGIRLMLDMVFNHTSTEHEWFKKALAGDKEYQDYYIFRQGIKEELPTNWVSKFGGPAWEYVDSLGKWYLHLFDVTQADLNWENPKVREELKKIILFWKNKGVSGFRFDVINLISKPEQFENDSRGDGRRFYTDGPRVHEYLKELVEDTGIAHMVTVGEMSSTSLEHCIKYSNPEEKELSMCFNFHHLKVDYKDGDKWALMPADRMALKKLFKTWQEGMQEGNGWNALFWTNHDQPRTISRFGDEETYFNESGKMLAAMIHFMRGTPYIYQGEEIGMLNTHFTDIQQYRDVESLNYYQILVAQGCCEEEALRIINARSRDNGRTPMQWDDSVNCGFTTGTPWIQVPEYGKHINVKSQLEDENSLLSFYQQLIRLRKELKIIAQGDIRFLYEESRAIMAYERRLGEECLTVICNMTKEPVEVSLDDTKGEILLSNYQQDEMKAGICQFRPYEFVAIYKA